jgi:hypothetical protein
MSNGHYIMPNKREVILQRINLTRTYSSVIEGSSESATKYILDSLSECVKDVMPPAEPLAAIIPDKHPLPEFIFVAELRSYESVRSIDPDHESFLFVCWFSNTLEVDIDFLLESFLLSLN